MAPGPDVPPTNLEALETTFPGTRGTYVCRYCGAPTEVEPYDQEAPIDYCHPEDHLSGDDEHEELRGL